MSLEQYNPQFFSSSSLEEAKNIVLMHHELSSEQRWEPETQWTKDILLAMRSFDEHSVVLDFGTGVGRLAKMLIETFGCRVLGVDINSQMLEFAKDYVNDSRFETMTNDDFINKRFKDHFTHAISVWALQHSPVSQHDIARIQQSLKRNGHLFVIDMRWKCIPKLDPGGNIHDTNFYDDKVDNKQELSKYFNPIAMGTIPVKATIPSISDISWWGFLEKNTK